MICIEDISELKVLFNVFYGFKYSIDEEEEERLIRSPFFSKIFNQALIELINKYESIDTIDGSKPDISEWNINVRSREVNIIIKKICSIDSWNDFNTEVKTQLVEVLVSPFIYSSKQVKDIIAQVDQIKSI